LVEVFDALSLTIAEFPIQSGELHPTLIPRER
jgi:hypothetical protein